MNSQTSELREIMRAVVPKHVDALKAHIALLREVSAQLSMTLEEKRRASGS